MATLFLASSTFDLDKRTEEIELVGVIFVTSSGLSLFIAVQASSAGGSPVLHPGLKFLLPCSAGKFDYILISVSRVSYSMPNALLVSHLL